MSRDIRRKLVELIELEPSIWDITSDDYCLNDRKKNAWARIMRAMKDEGHVCSMGELKVLWKNLKDQRKRRRTSTTGSAAGREWAYGDMLSFMDKTDFEGNTVRNLDENGNSTVPTFTDSPYVDRLEQSKEAVSIKKKKKEDDPIAMIRSATEVIKTCMEERESEEKRRVPDETGQEARKTNEDKFYHFGNWVAMQLRELDSHTADNKVHIIATVLMTDASISVNLDNDVRRGSYSAGQ
ncbi:hypothetical protein GCK32_010033 [Trichostrongylus colubriformis]|uniref:MADF domain-containing protein n=1 Tax=Trichostrongylus colubriformis TaxID=6319 RepID=A0AAN8FQA4_TRICO